MTSESWPAAECPAKKTTWPNGRETIEAIIYTADEMTEVFLPHEREALIRGEVVERGGTATTRYVDATAVALEAGL